MFNFHVVCWMWSKISTWKDFLQLKIHPDDQIQSTLKIIFIMKNLTDFRKTVETGVDPHLGCQVQSNQKHKWLH